MHARHAACVLTAALIAYGTDNSVAVTPDTSLSTIPVAYYGANWGRTQKNIDTLAKFQMVVLMQEDGKCWATCCPHRMDPRDPSKPGRGTQCGWTPTDPDATTIPFCNATCQQHQQQEDVFSRVAESANKQGLRGPHGVLYMNAVYLWPFDEAAKLGRSAMVTDIHGAPHEENCDPGIFPSYFFDYSKPAGRKAWLDIVQKHVVAGAADGVYVDCDVTVPFKCDPTNNTCIIRRNGKIKSINEVTTRDVVDAYVAGKNTTLQQAYQMVARANGSFYNKGAPQNKSFEMCVSYDPQKHAGHTQGDCSGNTIYSGPKVEPPPALHRFVTDNMKVGYPFVVVGGANDYSDPKHETQFQDLSDGRSLKECDDVKLAQFLLAVEPGAFFLCNGWDERFARPLGLPRSPPTLLHGSDSNWTRTFQSGVLAWYDTKTRTGAIEWP